jgi:hypothetical protein
MSKLRGDISISLDGFVAGPNQSEENPLGHDWVVPLAVWRESHGCEGGDVNESARIVEEARENVGRCGDGPEHVRPAERRLLGRRTMDGLVGRSFPSPTPLGLCGWSLPVSCC